MARRLPPTEKEICSFYQELRQISLEKCITINATRFLPFIPEEERTLAEQSPSLRPSMVLLARVAHKTTQKEFSDFILFGELPPIRLSSQEMEMLQGGISF